MHLYPTSTHSSLSLSLRDVSISVQGKALFSPLTFDVAPGDIVTVMGPSGCGKSSLLALISGSLDSAFAARGDVWVGGTTILALPPEQRRVGIQFQDDLLFPHLSVAQNLLFALESVRGAKQTRNERRAVVDAALRDASLDQFGDRDPGTLSGGQRARVALIRTLLAKPRVLLLDEPFNKLDAHLRSEFRDYVFAHARDTGLPTLLVTHDAADAEAAGGRVISLL